MNAKSPSFLRSCFLASSIVLCSILIANGQVTETDALRLAIEATMQSSPLGSAYERNNKRDPDLERIFSEVAKGSQMPVPFIFRFWCDGCSEGRFESVVAVSPKGKVFELRGAGALQHFESLSEDYHVRLRSNEDVEHYLAWYLAADPGNRGRNKLDTVEQVKAVAKRKFGEIQAFAPPEVNFDNWWQKPDKEAMGLRLGDEISEKANGFRVRFYILSDFDDKHLKRGPAFLRVSIEFSPDGKVTDRKKRTKVKHIG